MNKKELQKRREERRAYFQGGPELNNPFSVGYPEEIKYPKMNPPAVGDVREWEQGWFEGAAAETKPNMGPAGSELELKKTMLRAEENTNDLKKIAQDINEVIDELDKAGLYEEAGELEDIADSLSEEMQPTEQPVVEQPKISASVIQKLVKLADTLDAAERYEEATLTDEILNDLTN